MGRPGFEPRFIVPQSLALTIRLAGPCYYFQDLPNYCISAVVSLVDLAATVGFQAWLGDIGPPRVSSLEETTALQMDASLTKSNLANTTSMGLEVHAKRVEGHQRVTGWVIFTYQIKGFESVQPIKAPVSFEPA